MTNKVSYMNLLKEALDHDPPVDNVDVKGPMLDAILTYKGDGELNTHTSAAGILERYYFGENSDAGVNVIGEAETEMNPIDNEIDQVPSKDVKKTKKQIEKEITEAEDIDDDDLDIDEELDDDDTDVKESFDFDFDDMDGLNEDDDISDIGENAIIEKLIEEMESDIYEDEAIAENRVAGDRGEGTKAAGTLDSSPEKLIDEMMEEMVETDDLSEGISPDDMGIGDQEDNTGDVLEEAFQIFQESIEEDDVDDIDVDDIMV